jgi:hypothetical protein
MKIYLLEALIDGEWVLFNCAVFEAQRAAREAKKNYARYHDSPLRVATYVRHARFDAKRKRK